MAEKMPNALKSSNEDVAVSMYPSAEFKVDEEDSEGVAESETTGVEVGLEGVEVGIGTAWTTWTSSRETLRNT